MSNERLVKFLHLIKRADVFRLGSDFLKEANAKKIHLILVCETISAQNYKNVLTYVTNMKIAYYSVPANIMTSLYPGKTVKVLSVINAQSAKKIANLMKEGATYE